MKIIREKTIEFPKFYSMLCRCLNKNGELSDIKIDSCIILNIPENMPIFEDDSSVKLFGITLKTIRGRFMGFHLVKNVHIINNNFFRIGYDPKQSKTQ